MYQEYEEFQIHLTNYVNIELDILVLCGSFILSSNQSK